MEKFEVSGGSVSESRLVGLEKRAASLETVSLTLAARVAALEVAAGGVVGVDGAADGVSVGVLEIDSRVPGSGRRSISIGAFAPEDDFSPRKNSNVEKVQISTIKNVDQPVVKSRPELAKLRSISIESFLSKTIDPSKNGEFIAENDPSPGPRPNTTVHPDPKPAANAGSAPPQFKDVDTSSSIESQIGMYWLSKLGIGFLVIGVCLLIMYSFANFGPTAKIATGFIVSAILMAAGEYMEKRDNMPWYARLIEGGSWALGYFTTYAMYHVDSVKLINNPLIDLVLMLGVAGLAVCHATVKRSEIMAIFAVTLGFVTLALSHVSSFSAVAAAILVALSVFLCAREKWHQLNLYSVFACYGALLYCGSLNPVDGHVNFLTTALLLSPAFIGFGLAPLFLRVNYKTKNQDQDLAQDQLSRQSDCTAAVVNNLAFCWLFFSAGYREFGSGAAVYNLAVAVVLFVFGYFYQRANLAVLASINSSAALVLGTLYLFSNKPGDRLWLYLSCELAAVSWLSKRFDLKTFRWFAVLLAALVFVGNCFMSLSPAVISICGFTIPFVLVSSAAAVASLGGAAFWQNRRFDYYTFGSAAIILAWTLPLSLSTVHYERIGCLSESLQTSFLIGSWSCLAVVVMGLGIKLHNRFMQRLVPLISAWSALACCLNFHFSWITSGLGVAVLYACAFVFRHCSARPGNSTSTSLFKTQFLIAFGATAVLPLGAGMAAHAAVAYLSVQALVGLLLGMRISDNFVRLLPALVLPAALVVALRASLSWLAIAPLLASLWTSWALYALSARSEKICRDPRFFEDESVVRHLYSVLAAALVMITVLNKCSVDWIDSAWMLESLALLAVGFILRDQILRYSALGVSALLVLRVLTGINHQWFIYLPVVCGLILARLAYYLPAGFGIKIGRSCSSEADLDQGEREVRHFYSIAASAVLVFFLGYKNLSESVSFFWSLAGLLLLVAGLLLRDRVLRLASLGVFASLIYALAVSHFDFGPILPAGGGALQRLGPLSQNAKF